MMKDDNVSPQRRRMLIPLALAPLATHAGPAAAQGIPGPISGPGRHSDWRWFLQRPSEHEGITHIEIRYADINILRRVGVTVDSIDSHPMLTLTPESKNWRELMDAYSKTTFSINQSGGNFVDWAVYVYTKRGICRAISFRDPTGLPAGQDLWGCLDYDRVYVHGPLPYLLRSLIDQGDLKFPRQG